ncbi:MAG: histidine triad nucleotide-binding protein [Gammaproteobacteria bacterium]|nr:histidine triad nucleotide-binding protein [Gammaproteobacteria bacterium]
MTDCLFCKINNGDIPADIIYQDDDVCAFRDISAQAPTHFLVIPKKHISTINDLESSDSELVGKMFLAAAKITKQEGVSESGFRTVMNCNSDGGQTVFHVHLHVLGGRVLTWPPG